MNLSDFRSIHFKIDFENLTSRTQYTNHPASTFQELGSDHTILFTLPVASCNQGHHLMFKIVRDDLPPTDPVFQMELTCRVLSINSTGPHLVHVKTMLLQVEQTRWNEFLVLLTSRQDAINRLIEKMRGKS